MVCDLIVAKSVIQSLQSAWLSDDCKQQGLQGKLVLYFAEYEY